MMTIKVHYTTTRALRVSSSITYQQLQNLICKKFDCPADSLTLWSKKKNGDLSEIESDQTFKDVSAALDDGFRLTLWAYDKDEVFMIFEIVSCHKFKAPPTPTSN